MWDFFLTNYALTFANLSKSYISNLLGKVVITIIEILKIYIKIFIRQYYSNEVKKYRTMYRGQGLKERL